jgi:hypothetical protein
MDHSEIRKYPEWPYHMLTCVVAHFFLWHLKIRWGKTALALAGSSVRMLLEVVYPLKMSLRWLPWYNGAIRMRISRTDGGGQHRAEATDIIGISMIQHPS